MYLKHLKRSLCDAALLVINTTGLIVLSLGAAIIYVILAFMLFAQPILTVCGVLGYFLFDAYKKTQAEKRRNSDKS